MPQAILNPNNERIVNAYAARGWRSFASALVTPKLTFTEFVQKAWPILEPANPLLHDWYIDAICEHLQLVTDGQIQKLLINIPPRFGKSNLVTILWPAWTWTVKPFLRFISCSYSASLSVKHSVDRRRVMESPWYQMLWGSVVNFRDDQNMKNEYENTARGHMIATSVGGTLTGKGGDCIIEDDMINPVEAESAAARTHAVTMHQSVLSSRLDNPKRGVRVIVEQRTHHMDLTAHVLKSETGWVHLNLPLVSEKQTIITLPVSKKEIVREQDSILNPHRFGPKEVEDLKRVMGTKTFASQCQQNPTAEIGNILKRQWWKRWTVLPSGFDILVTSWDMTFKETQSGSYVVGQVWGRSKARYYLIDQVRARMDFNEAQSAVRSLAARYPLAMGHLIEDKANGPAIISALRGVVAGILPIEPHGSKYARAQAISPIVEAGNAYIPEDASCVWVPDFVEECAAFKGIDGEINDQVDTASQAIYWLSQSRLITPDILTDEGSFIDGDDTAGGGFAG